MVTKSAVRDITMASDKKFEPPYTQESMVKAVAQQFAEGLDFDMALPTEERTRDAQAIARVHVRVQKLPHYHGLGDLNIATIGSAGVDLFCAVAEPICLNNMGARAIIPTGISIELPIGYEAQIRPRSGLAAKEGITVLNSPGTIDSDFRGEIGVILVNLSTKRFFVTRGMRIAQMVIKPVCLPSLEYVEELSKTGRGSDGFGSSGT